MRIYVYFFILLASSLLGCSPDFESMAKNRLEHARQKVGDIRISVFKDKPDSTYLEGVLLAVDEVNQRPGKLAGRQLKVEIEQDGKTFEDTKSAVRRVADNPNITAVLGHADSEIAVPASVIYERSQLVFMPPLSTAQGLTSHNFKYVFRMMPNSKVMTEQLASVASILGYKKMVVLFARDDINREKAFLFEEAAIHHKIDLSQNLSFFEKETNFRPLISQFTTKPFDAIFIAAGAEPTAELVKQIREMGIYKPVLGNSGLGQANYTDSAGAAANNTIIPNVYRQGNANPLSMAFAASYRAKYHKEPDSRAAQGYDSVMLLAAAIQKAGSTIPPLLSSTLHYMKAWIGVTGLHAFNEAGDLLGKKYIFDVWRNGQWHSLPAIHIPYLIARFEKSLPKPKQPEAAGPSSFSELFATKMGDDQHKMLLMELAFAILKFEIMGVIYEDTEDGRKASDYNLIKQVADKQKAFAVNGCAIPFSSLDRKSIERELITCYGKLSLEVDTMYVTGFEGINQNLAKQLNLILPLFKSSSLSLDGKRRTDANVSMVLDRRSDVDPLGLGDMQIYRGLLNDVSVNDLAEYLYGLPEIAINLEELQKLEVSDHALLQLSPDDFIGIEAGVGQEIQEAQP